MSRALKEKDKEYIYLIKGLAIFCVVCAHSSSISDNAGGVTHIISELLNYLGTMGVPVLFCISGYLFARNKKSWSVFWRRKLVTIIVPWIFCETLLWLYVVVRKGGMSLDGWGKFLIGYKSSTYYLTILMIFYVIFWGLKSEILMYSLTILSIISIICTGWGFGIDIINVWTGTFYLNPLNWAVFFLVGMILSKKEIVFENCNKIIKYTPLLFAASLVYFCGHMLMGETIYYFSRFALIAHIINSLLIAGIAGFLLRSDCRTVGILLGKYSFTIYLLHQFLAGVVVAISNYLGNVIVIAMRPVIILIVLAFAIKFLRWINEKSGNKFVFLERLIGIRE